MRPEPKQTYLQIVFFGEDDIALTNLGLKLFTLLKSRNLQSIVVVKTCQICVLTLIHFFGMHTERKFKFISHETSDSETVWSGR